MPGFSRSVWTGATLLALPAVLAFACGGGSNNKSSATMTSVSVTPTRVATRTAAAAVGTAPAASTGAPSAQSPATATLSPELAAIQQELTPLLLKIDELPSTQRTFQAAPPLFQSNDELFRGQPDAGALQQQLTNAGRKGTLTATWAKAGGEVQPNSASPLNVIIALAKYGTPEAAKSGCPFVFSKVQPVVNSPNGDETRTQPLTVDPVGNGFTTYRVDYAFTGVIGTPTPVPVRLKETLYEACWYRGTIVATVQLGSLNQDPSLDDFKQILQAVDQKLKAAAQQ